MFGRLDARVDLVDVAGKVAQLEETYTAVVREWGQSIESSDSYTFGHCERVAGYGVAVARAMGLDATGQTTVRMGAYLHDLGKVRVPHEILNKPGPLTPEEFEVIKQHPVWGLELLATVHFPWDIKPIIRWHHERSDGTGYPDRLQGEEIPLGAQIICIVDVYDALTTTRSYRSALSRRRRCSGWRSAGPGGGRTCIGRFRKRCCEGSRVEGLDPRPLTLDPLSPPPRLAGLGQQIDRIVVLVGP